MKVGEHPIIVLTIDFHIIFFYFRKEKEGPIFIEVCKKLQIHLSTTFKTFLWKDSSKAVWGHYPNLP